MVAPLTRLNLATCLLKHRGKSLDLAQFPYIQAAYECRVPSMLFKTGRQVTKSSTLANLLLIECALNDYFHVLFTTPLQEQVSRFSRGYLDAGIKDSPAFKKVMYAPSDCTWNVLEKSLKNRSRIYLTYCHDSPDRARGLTADLICYDEAQDIPWEFLPIMNETMSASKHRWNLVAGTPKTLEGTLEVLWEDSSQHEWIMRCESCNKWNLPTVEYIYDMIEPYGLCCASCKKLIDPRNGQWHPLQPEKADRCVGFHIPQLIVPRNVLHNTGDPDDAFPKVPRAWQDLYVKYTKYPPALFANEVLGLSQDSGGRVVTLTELKACCTLPEASVLRTKSYSHGCTYICAGVDWGISATESFTVLTIGGRDPSGDVKVLYVKKFHSTDTVVQSRQIAEICGAWGVSAVGADFGVGYTNNLLLREMLGYEKILEYQYASAAHILRYNADIGRYILNKTSSLNLMFFDIKAKRIRFPALSEEMMELFSDVLSIYEDVIEGPRSTYKVFRRTPTIPDDFAHSLNFMCITAKKLSGDPIVSMKADDAIYEEHSLICA